MRVRIKEKFTMKFQSAKYFKSAVSICTLPNFAHQPEIAVVGRSNVGKSTLLNHLFGTKNLVKTSSSPGKTRALNFFIVDDQLVFVDLPGYGYAKVSKEEKKKWGGLIEDYLNNRPQLNILLLLLDIRREPSQDDLTMLDWIEHSQMPTIVLLTKVDKVKPSQRVSQTKQITSRLKGLPHVHYSATKNIGRKALIAKIHELLTST